MKRIKKLLCLLLAVLLMVGTLASCDLFSTDPDEPTQTAKRTETKKQKDTDKPKGTSQSPDTDDPSKPDDPAKPEVKGSEGLVYTLLEDGTYAVSEIGTATESDIVIPAVYNGKAVTAIEDKAFADCEDLKSITIPDSITSMGEDAFYDCDYLSKVFITDLAKWCGIKFSNVYANPLSHGANCI